MFVRYDHESVQLIMCSDHSPTNLKMLLRQSSHHAQQYRCHCCCSLPRGHAVAQLLEALRYKLEGCGFNSRWCHQNFSLT